MGRDVSKSTNTFQLLAKLTIVGSPLDTSNEVMDVPVEDIPNGDPQDVWRPK